MKSNRLLEMFRAGQTAVGGWMSLDSAYAAELVGCSGFDAVVVDCQHGMAGHAQMVAMLQAFVAHARGAAGACQPEQSR